MREIKYAELYVEEYDSNYLLLDFINENEFIFFRNNGDYHEQMKLNEYSPCMLLFKNVGRLHLRKGDILSLPMEALLSLKIKHQNSNFYNPQFSDATPYNLYMTFENKNDFGALFKGQAIKKTRFSSKKHIQSVLGTWQIGSPCALNQLSNTATIEVFDVGQGNTNAIYDDSNVTFFDFGASIFYSKYKLLDISNDIFNKFKHHNKSLIISHWDCDHYNLLTVLSDNLFRQFCCVFIPAQVITLTAKQIIKKIQTNCLWFRTFTPTKSHNKRVGLTPVISTPEYILYIGEQSRNSNLSGLALTFQKNNTTTIFSADHSNYQIWSVLYPSLCKQQNTRLNIIIPHHGGKSTRTKIPSITGIPCIAAISVGKNPYKHPNQHIIDNYINAGFDIQRTDWERKSIFIQT